MGLMKRKGTAALLALMMLVSGCGSEKTGSTSSPEISGAPMSGDVYENYTKSVDGAEDPDNATVAVSNSYEMHFSDETMDAYDMDEVLTYETDNGDVTAHLSQNIDSNGMQSTLDGYYYGGRFYNSVNDVTYYEDMSFDALKKAMLVPLEAYSFAESDIEKITGQIYPDGSVSYTVVPSEDAIDDLFTGRYDQYGLSSFDDFDVKSGTVTDTFNAEGILIRESADFVTEVSYEGQKIEADYSSDVTVDNIGTSAAEITDDMKKEQAQYVSYQDIDTSNISTESDDDDTPEDTVTDTFKKRLVNRLGYTVDEDTGKYSLSFNSDSESYEIDFKNYTFEYSERSIHYVYNWKSDFGSMGTCSVDFANGDKATSECKDSTVDTIKDVKSYLEMELYYCGLLLEDLQAEAD